MSAPIIKRVFYLNSFNNVINKYNSIKIINSYLSSNTNVQEIESSKKSVTIDDIVIPKRVERGPTDILRALSYTIGKDYTAPHYKYNDDPFLIPTSVTAKRSYALSKESGRRAAKYFMDNYPQLFYTDPAEPKIEAFSYKDKYDENTVVDEEDLKKCIVRREIANCITIYQNMKNSGKEITDDTLLEMLQLMCFYNCEEPNDEEFLEEKWFKMTDNRKKWNINGFAEELFNAMPKTSESYCAIIQGMAKYNAAEKAFHLYQQMKDKQLLCNVETYNLLISIVPYLRESSETRWQMIEELLTNMKNEGIKPNLGTFNTLLQQISKFHYYKSAKPLAQKVMVEMKVMGIRPSLASYYYLLSIFCKENGPVSPILYDIMDEIENKRFIIRDPNDAHFFVKAMEVCQTHLSDVQLAYRVNDLLNLGNNHKLIGNSVSESKYYQKFFKIISASEDIDTFMGIYNKYCPNIYSPEQNIFIEIIQTVQLYEAYHYVPQLWSDTVVFDFAGRFKIVSQLLNLMGKAVIDDEKLRQQFVSIASDIIQRLDNEMEKKGSRTMDAFTEWTGDALGCCLMVFLNGKDLEKAHGVIQKLSTEVNKILGFPNTDSLTKFCTEAIDAKQYAYALYCIKYANDNGINEVGLSALKYCQSLNLNESITDSFEKMCVNETEKSIVNDEM